MFAFPLSIDDFFWLRVRAVCTKSYQVYISCVSRSAFETRRHRTIPSANANLPWTVCSIQYHLRCQLKCCYFEWSGKRRERDPISIFHALIWRQSDWQIRRFDHLCSPFVYVFFLLFGVLKMRENLWLHYGELRRMNLGQKSICFQEVAFYTIITALIWVEALWFGLK